MAIQKLSRRGFLKGVGAGAGATIWFSLSPALAQTDSPAANVTAFSRFNIGDFEVTVLQDTLFPLDAAILGVNATPEEINAVLEANNLSPDTVRTTVNVMLVNTGDQLILLDTGNGAANGGRLLPTLELLGITPDAINAVVISHLHPDHIGGAANNGAAAFPNATYYFPQAEWDFMQTSPADSPAAGMIAGAMAALQPAIDTSKIAYYAADGEILPGIEAVAAHGHTPGHSALLVKSSDAQLLNMVDTAINNVISLSRPDWSPGFDSIPEMAVESRRALLTRANEEGLQVFGYHFPFPGVGYITAEGEGFTFVPAF